MQGNGGSSAFFGRGFFFSWAVGSVGSPPVDSRSHAVMPNEDKSDNKIRLLERPIAAESTIRRMGRVLALLLSLSLWLIGSAAAANSAQPWDDGDPVSEPLARQADTMALFVGEGARGFVSAATGEATLRRVLVPIDEDP